MQQSIVGSTLALVLGGEAVRGTVCSHISTMGEEHVLLRARGGYAVLVRPAGGEWTLVRWMWG